MIECIRIQLNEEWYLIFHAFLIGKINKKYGSTCIRMNWWLLIDSINSQKLNAKFEN